MEVLPGIPPEVAKYNPAYEHMAFWLTNQGLMQGRAQEAATRSFSFLQTADGLLSEETAIIITGKGQEHDISPLF